MRTVIEIFGTSRHWIGLMIQGQGVKQSNDRFGATGGNSVFIVCRFDALCWDVHSICHPLNGANDRFASQSRDSNEFISPRATHDILGHGDWGRTLEFIYSNVCRRQSVDSGCRLVRGDHDDCDGNDPIDWNILIAKAGEAHTVVAGLVGRNREVAQIV